MFYLVSNTSKNAIVLQSMDAANIYTAPAAMPANAAMVKSMPALMTFYGRLRDKVFPDGPSDKWLEGMFDPKRGVSSISGSGGGGGSTYATKSDAGASTSLA